MLMAKQLSNRKLTLYRGESYDAFSGLNESGISWDARLNESGLSLEDLQHIRENFTNLSNTSPEIVPIIAKSVILRHVAQHKRSPFVSFTGKEEVARHYALNNGQRKEGMVITTNVTVAEELAWETINVTGLYIDDAGRLWLHVPAYWPIFKSEMLVQPEMVEALRLSFRDDEYLLFGDLSCPKDFRMEGIRV